MRHIGVDDIRKVLIIGAGTMGQQVGFLCAAKGFDTTIYDLSQPILDNAYASIEKLSALFVSRGMLSNDNAQDAIARITLTTDERRAGEDADFLSESVTESLDVKCRVLEKFGAVCPPHTVFTTNTSTLIPSLMAHATGRPPLFAAFHFHNTVSTNIVDIMPHPGTADETVDLIRKFAIRLGQTPILIKKENYGYAFNAILMNLCDTALYLAAAGVSTIEDIDRAWMGIMRMDMGPFGIMDSVGLDTVLKINEIWAQQLNDPKAMANMEFLKKYTDAGKLGKKTGEGFYTYPNPAFKSKDFISTASVKN